MFALVLGCGLPNAPVTVSLPKIQSGKAPTRDDLGPLSSDQRWWTRIHIENGNHALEIFPDDRGGVRAFVETGNGTTMGDWRSRASFVDVDAAGREVRNVSAIEGVQVNTGKIALGKNGEIVFAGGYEGAVGIEGVKITDTNNPKRSLQLPMYLVALDRQGHLAWRHTFYNAQLRSIARRSDGVVVVTGMLEQQGDFGGGTIGARAVMMTFIAAFDAHGNHLFSRAFDTSNYDARSRVAFAGDGTIELFANLGFNMHDIDFGDGPHRGIASLATAMARFDDHGKCLKSSIISLLANGVAVGPSGDAVLSGETIEDEPDKRSLLIMRIDSDGHEVWRHEFPSDTIGFRWAPVALDAHGNTLTAILGPTTSEGETWEDIILFDTDGEEIYKRRMQGNDVRISDVAFSSAGNAFIAGQSMWKDIVYDGHVLPAEQPYGVFVMKLPNLAANHSGLR